VCLLACRRSRWRASSTVRDETRPRIVSRLALEIHNPAQLRQGGVPDLVGLTPHLLQPLLQRRQKRNATTLSCATSIGHPRVRHPHPRHPRNRLLQPCRLTASPPPPPPPPPAPCPNQRPTRAVGSRATRRCSAQVHLHIAGSRGGMTRNGQRARTTGC